MASVDDSQGVPGAASDAAGRGSFTFSDDLDEAFALIVEAIRLSPVTKGLARSGRYQNQLLALDAELLAKQKADGASDSQIERLAGRGSKSTRTESKKRARRATAVNLNPTLGSDLADGDIGVDQLDAIAAGARATDGAAAQDDKLIDKVKNAKPDDAKAIVKEWVDDHNTSDDNENRRDRQRRFRRVRRYTTRNGTDAITAEGDTETINEIWNSLRAYSKKLFEKDGGRDLPAGKHPRTRDQRMFDALHQTTTSTGGQGPGGGFVAKLHLHMTLDELLANNLKAVLASGAALPPSVLARYMCNGTIAGTIYAQDGTILWHGRDVRYATPEQYSALVARDRCCTICAADASECEAHHVIAWTAPLQGETNIANLALVCTDCHHHIHNNNLTMYRQHGMWKLRPATPTETPRNHHHTHK